MAIRPEPLHAIDLGSYASVSPGASTIAGPSPRCRAIHGGAGALYAWGSKRKRSGWCIPFSPAPSPRRGGCCPAPSSSTHRQAMPTCGGSGGWFGLHRHPTLRASLAAAPLAVRATRQNQWRRQYARRCRAQSTHALTADGRFTAGNNSSAQLGTGTADSRVTGAHTGPRQRATPQSSLPPRTSRRSPAMAASGSGVVIAWPAGQRQYCGGQRFARRNG